MGIFRNMQNVSAFFKVRLWMLIFLTLKTNAWAPSFVQFEECLYFKFKNGAWHSRKYWCMTHNLIVKRQNEMRRNFSYFQNLLLCFHARNFRIIGFSIRDFLRQSKKSRILSSLRPNYYFWGQNIKTISNKNKIFLSY